jgi:hypothetical protein
VHPSAPIVGFAFVEETDQTIPLPVNDVPPKLVILPPNVAVVFAIVFAVGEVIIGAVAAEVVIPADVVDQVENPVVFSARTL